MTPGSSQSSCPLAADPPDGRPAAQPCRRSRSPGTTTGPSRTSPASRPAAWRRLPIRECPPTVGPRPEPRRRPPGARPRRGGCRTRPPSGAVTAPAGAQPQADRPCRRASGRPSGAAAQRAAADDPVVPPSPVPEPERSPGAPGSEPRASAGAAHGRVVLTTRRAAGYPAGTWGRRRSRRGQPRRAGRRPAFRQQAAGRGTPSQAGRCRGGRAAPSRPCRPRRRRVRDRGCRHGGGRRRAAGWPASAAAAAAAGRVTAEPASPGRWPQPGWPAGGRRPVADPSAARPRPPAGPRARRRPTRRRAGPRPRAAGAYAGSCALPRGPRPRRARATGTARVLPGQPASRPRRAARPRRAPSRLASADPGTARRPRPGPAPEARSRRPAAGRGAVPAQASAQRIARITRYSTNGVEHHVVDDGGRQHLPHRGPGDLRVADRQAAAARPGPRPRPPPPSRPRSSAWPSWLSRPRSRPHK